MIRRSLPDGDLLIPQFEHALHAGRLAAAHRDLPGQREALVRAVEMHDAGWPMFDDRPAPLADGRPPHVFNPPPGATVPAWRRSVAVARGAGPLEALLVSRHFSRFSSSFRTEQEPWQAAWRIGVEPEVEEAGHALLYLCDAISLRLLCDPGESVRLPEGVELRAGRMSPWPFAVDKVRDWVVGVKVPRRKWSSKKELTEAMRSAPRVAIELVLKPMPTH